MRTDPPSLRSARAFLREHFPGGGRVLCAVSGGLDSMCLLHYVRRQTGFSVTAAHFNHRLRGENADRDEAFVRGYCAEREIPFLSGGGDVRALAAAEGLSIEEAARNLRYAFLQAAAERDGFDAILTAHHADDNAETVLLNLIRGGGSAGLSGIPSVRGNIYRPLLSIPRRDLEAYAEAWGIPHVEDETNLLEDASRNVLRRRVIPVLKELNPAAVENMSHAAAILRRESAVVEALAAELTAQAAEGGDGVSLPRAPLLAAPRAVAERAVLRLLAAAGHSKDLAAVHVEAVLELARAGAEGQTVSLPYGLVAGRVGDALRIRRREPLPAVELSCGSPVCWGDYTLTLLDHREGEGLALRPGTEPLTVACCPAGRRLTLPGARGARTVKRLCVDQRISIEERDRLPAIYENGCLAAVWRLGVDEAFLPEGEPCRFIQIYKETKKETKRHE